MEEEQLSPIAVSHLLQHTLRSLCIHDNSQWIYAVFWRILPRNYPPPKWEGHGAYDRSRGNRRNWILVWEDGFCNFNAAAASSSSTRGDDQMNNSMGSTSDCGAAAGPPVYGNSSCDQFQHYHGGHGLQPELFFKMSHEIYNYGEGLIGKVASDHTHKWIYKEPNDDQEINFLSTWHNSADSHPRTWEAQFQSGIKTIALIAVREGVVQLGAVHKVIEDLSYVVLLRKKLSYIESIPGALLPHPSSSSSFPFKLDHDVHGSCYGTPPDHLHHHDAWHSFQGGNELMMYHHDDHNFNMNNNNNPILKNITPSMSSLEALLSKLPSVVPSPDQLQPHTSHQFVLSPPPPPPLNHHHQHHGVLPLQFMDHKVAKGETQYRDHDNEDQYDNRPQKNNVAGETSTSMPPYGRSQQHHFHHH